MYRTCPDSGEIAAYTPGQSRSGGVSVKASRPRVNKKSLSRIWLEEIEVEGPEAYNDLCLDVDSILDRIGEAAGQNVRRALYGYIFESLTFAEATSRYKVGHDRFQSLLSFVRTSLHEGGYNNE